MDRPSHPILTVEKTRDCSLLAVTWLVGHVEKREDRGECADRKPEPPCIRRPPIKSSR